VKVDGIKRGLARQKFSLHLIYVVIGITATFVLYSAGGVPSGHAANLNLAKLIPASRNDAVQEQKKSTGR
jgi:hypothetical protein